MIRRIISTDGDVVIELSSAASMLSSTVDGGLRYGVRFIIHHHVPKDFNADSATEVKVTHIRLGINSNEVVTFLTAAELPKSHVIHNEQHGDIDITVSVTMGLSNPYRIDGPRIIEMWRGPSTVNIAIIVNRPLAVTAMVDAIALSAEAKHETLSSLSGGRLHGTTSDALAIVSLGEGEPEPYAGPATRVGKAIVSSINNALTKAYTIVESG
jgi:adenosylcobinamide amidohydrolase